MFALFTLLHALAPTAAAQATLPETSIGGKLMPIPILDLEGGGIGLMGWSSAVVAGPRVHVYDQDLRPRWSIDLEIERRWAGWMVELQRRGPLPVPTLVPRVGPLAPGAQDLTWTEVDDELRVFSGDARGLVAHRLHEGTGEVHVEVLSPSSSPGERKSVLLAPNGRWGACLSTTPRSGVVHVQIFDTTLRELGQYDLEVVSQRGESWPYGLRDLDLDNHGRLVATWSDGPHALRVDRHEHSGHASTTRIDLRDAYVRDSLTRVGMNDVIAVAAELGERSDHLDTLMLATIGLDGEAHLQESRLTDPEAIQSKANRRSKLVRLDPTSSGGWLVGLRPVYQIQTPGLSRPTTHVDEDQRSSVSPARYEVHGDLQLRYYSADPALRWVREIDMDHYEPLDELHTVRPLKPSEHADYTLHEDGEQLVLVFYDVDDEGVFVAPGSGTIHRSVLGLEDGEPVREIVLPLGTLLHRDAPLGSHIRENEDGTADMLLGGRHGQAILKRVDTKASP